MARALPCHLTFPSLEGFFPKRSSGCGPTGIPGLFSRSTGRGRHDIEDEKFLEEGLRVLYPGIRLDGTEDELAASLPYITEVLSFLDYLIVNEQPAKPRWGRDKLTRLRLLFDRLVCDVLSTRYTIPRKAGGL